MSWPGGTLAEVQQVKAVVQQSRELPDAECIDPGGGEFDRQREPVELAADVGYGRSVPVVQCESVQDVRRAVDEQLNGGECQRRHRGKPGWIGWEIQRRQTINLFTF